jgi:hypothetical protein
MTRLRSTIPDHRRKRLPLLASAALIAVVAACSAGGSGKPSSTASRDNRAPAIDATPPSVLDGISGTRPTKWVDLAGEWSFTPITDAVCDDSPAGPLHCSVSRAREAAATISVPGGGWVKQGYPNVSEARYSRTITVPKITGAQVTKLAFGAVNNLATLYIDGRRVATQFTAYTPSTFDISNFVLPGHTYRVDVDVKGRRALIGADGRYDVPEGASWSDDVAQGIYRSAALEVYPAVHISDAVVQTSVRNRSLRYTVSVTNATNTDRRVTLTGALGSVNGRDWRYPQVPRVESDVRAHTTKQLTIGPLAWRAPSASYWWPNVPYRPNYRAQLHDLDLRLVSSAQPAASIAVVRFGFREIDQVRDHYELNAVRVNFRGDNLQGANFDNIDHGGRGDAYDTLPGFLPPSPGNGGWPTAVENYLHLNYNSVRIHQIPASPYMLDVTDALGLMVLDETAIRGSNNRENFAVGRSNMIANATALVQRDRNHAAVLRWSEANEPDVPPIFENPGAGPQFEAALYRAVMAQDTTRPISTDGNSQLLPYPNYAVFCHYGGGVAIGTYTDSTCPGRTGKPSGQGEYIWPADSTPQGFTWFATATMAMRIQNASDARPYTLLSAWNGFIPGVKRTDMTLESGYPNGAHPIYGNDNLPDPWANSTIQLIQRAFSPVAAIDDRFWQANHLSNKQGAWPTTPLTIPSGTSTRTLTIFNDAFSGTLLDISWSLHTGSATGPTISHGSLAANVPLGTHRPEPITITVPTRQQTVSLVINVSKPGQGALFRDASTVYRVATS